MNQTRKRFIAVCGLAVLGALATPWCAHAAEVSARPNIVMIAIDDLNDWVGCLGGHPQTKTPNIDRLASRGMLFTDAHCQAPFCNPSRASVMSGSLPSSTGVYENLPTTYGEPLPTYWDRARVVTMGEHFGANGYQTIGVGKIFHQCKWKDTFQEYGPEASFGPKPKEKIQKEIDGFWHDWGRFPESDENTEDYKVATWAIDQLKQPMKQPFFLAAGFIRPHTPHFAPAKWFDLIGEEKDIQLPPILAGDIDDLPMAGKTLDFLGGRKLFEEIQKGPGLKSYAHAYLACIAFVDHQIGRVLDALEASPYAGNTIVVLWSDHGYHLGEKDLTGKFTPWQRSSRVPLIVAGGGIEAGTRCDQPVGLVDLFPTLCDLTGVSKPVHLEGHSLQPQLCDPKTPHPPVLVTVNPNNHAIISPEYRYIRYADGSEELYDRKADPNEWHNLASKAEMRPVMDQLATHLPKVNVPAIPKN
jgi:arylsulfatase A-like enzyme